MEQLIQHTSPSSVADILAQLRQSLAGADPLASSTLEPFLTQARTLDKTLREAPQAMRLAQLLRALDEAIAAIEVAAAVADALHPTLASEIHASKAAAADHTADPLVAAYRAFVESQPAYQGLYHFRNALAEHLSHTQPETTDAP